MVRHFLRLRVVRHLLGYGRRVNADERAGFAVRVVFLRSASVVNEVFKIGGNVERVTEARQIEIRFVRCDIGGELNRTVGINRPNLLRRKRQIFFAERASDFDFGRNSVRGAPVLNHRITFEFAGIFALRTHEKRERKRAVGVFHHGRFADHFVLHVKKPLAEPIAIRPAVVVDDGAERVELWTFAVYKNRLPGINQAIERSRRLGKLGGERRALHENFRCRFVRRNRTCRNLIFFGGRVAAHLRLGFVATDGKCRNGNRQKHRGNAVLKKFLCHEKFSP